jgi:thymidylate synthase
MSEQQYLNLLQDVLDNGIKKSIFGHEDKYLLSVFGRMLRFDLTKGFPIYTTKKVSYKGAFKEMIWFLEGSGDVTKLHRAGCTIWDEWGVKYHNKVNKTNYSMKEWQSLVDTGAIASEVIPLHYGNMTNWKYIRVNARLEDDGGEKYIDGAESTIDQTKWVIDYIQKTPDRKSFLVNSWNPIQVYQMADESNNESVSLPTCHYSHQIIVNQGKLSLLVNIRSNDLFLGNPYNVAQYALLTHMYAKCTNNEVGELVVSLGDAHLYSDHVEQAKEQRTRTLYMSPTFNIKDRGQKYLQDFCIDDFEVVGYKSHPTLKGDITVVGGY